MNCNPARYEELTATVEAAAYASGDTFGEKLVFEGALREIPSHGAILGTLTLTGLNTQTFAFDIVFFKEDFGESTDNDPFSVSDADLEDKCLGFLTVATTDWITTANHAIATLNTAFMLTSDATGTIYAQMIARGAVTPGSTSDYTVKLGLLKS